jgi:hypothetical protein
LAAASTACVPLQDVQVALLEQVWQLVIPAKLEHNEHPPLELIA